MYLTSFFKTSATVALLLILSACKAHIQEQQSPRQDHHQTIGTTQAVLFIHGMFLTPDSWTDWQQHFEDIGFTTLAPAWPLHEQSVAELNQLHPSAELGQLTFDEVVNHYRTILSSMDEKPIVVGHSMGGLVAQTLLQEDLIAAAIAIHSAPPFGVISIEPTFLRANWPLLNPAYSAYSPLKLSFSQFQYGFANGMTEHEQRLAYDQYMVPESRKVGRATTTTVTRIEDDIARGPLLMISGGEDRTITASLNYANYQVYADAPSISDYKQFPQRNHWTIAAPGWEEVADYVIQWIEANR